DGPVRPPAPTRPRVDHHHDGDLRPPSPRPAARRGGRGRTRHGRTSARNSRWAVSGLVHNDHDKAAEAPTPGYLPFAPPSDVITLYEGPLRLKVDGGLSSERPGK